MADPAQWHRLQFAFTIVYHYLFPQLTMGLGVLLVFWRAQSLRHPADPSYLRAFRFWSRIFGLNFAVGVVTGIPMEFQLGTNWARFARYSGGVVGQTLAMEGMFAFFLESALVAAMVWGERRLGPRRHMLATAGVCLGSWLSAYFIVTTNAFMQHPQGHALEGGRLVLADLGAFLGNPWAPVQFLHNQMASLVTATFVVAGVSALYLLRGVHADDARVWLRHATVAGLASALLVAFPTGDAQAKLVAEHQPAALAAMEGRFATGDHAELTLIGQPNVAARRIDNAVAAPWVLSILAYGTPKRSVRGLNDFPEANWPTNIELLYYAFHLMAGLGTCFIAAMAWANWQGWRNRLHLHRPTLWLLMLLAPLPYVANTAGWMTAELGRQPWLIYGLMRTSEGFSASVPAGAALFTLIGFCGLYLVLGLLFVFLVGREIAHGPGSAAPSEYGQPAEADHG